jgi:hypothetical protein
VTTGTVVILHGGEMGFESIIYGRIDGPTWRPHDYRKLQRLNREVIDALPETDDWPFLTRSMFAVPGEEPEQGTYRSQVIHFGASLKEVEQDWEAWLAKFEALLSRLYWYSAKLHLEAEHGGDHQYEWLIEQDQIDRWLQDPPHPVSRWKFQGGPRVFGP